MRYYGKRKRYGRFKRRLGVKRRMGKRLQRRYGSFNQRFRAKRYFRKAVVPSLLPQRSFVTLRATFPWQLLEDGPLAPGTIVNNPVRGNGAFDPWQPLGGGSPKYYSWYAQVYAKYRVHASKVIVTFYNLSQSEDTTFTGDIVAGIYISDEVGPYGDLESAMEEVTCKWVNLPRMVDTLNSGERLRTAHTSPTIRHGAMTKKVLSVKDISDSANYQSGVTGLPPTQWYYNIFVGRHKTTPGLTNAKVYARVTVIYKMEFFDRKELDI